MGRVNLVTKLSDLFPKFPTMSNPLTGNHTHEHAPVCSSPDPSYLLLGRGGDPGRSTGSVRIVGGASR